MKKGLKSFLKYVLFSGFLSVSAVASPIASPGTSTIYNGTNSSVLYSPTVTSSGSTCQSIINLGLRSILTNQHIPGSYAVTINLTNFEKCSNFLTLVIKAAGGSGGGLFGGTGGITILKIPVSTLLQDYGPYITLTYLVGGAGGTILGSNGVPGGYDWSIYGGGAGGAGTYGYGGGGGGETLVSLGNWPWFGGVPLVVSGGGGGSGAGYDEVGGYVLSSSGGNFTASSSGTFGGYGGGGGGGNDSGESGSCDWGNGGGGGGGGNDGIGGFGMGSILGGIFGGGGGGWYGWYGPGGYGGSGDWGGGGGGAGYGGGGGGYEGGYYTAMIIVSPSQYVAAGGCGGGGGGGYCNTSLGTCEALDWTNGSGNIGNGYLKIYIETTN